MTKSSSTTPPPSMVRVFAEPGDRIAYWRSISPDGEPIVIVVMRGTCQDGQPGYMSWFTIGDPQRPRIRAQDDHAWAELSDCWKAAVMALAGATGCDPTAYRLASRG